MKFLGLKAAVSIASEGAAHEAVMRMPYREILYTILYRRTMGIRTCCWHMSAPFKFLTARERFARNLREWRSKRGLSQEALAAESGLSRVFLSRVETAAATVSLDNVEKLANVLGIDIVDLLLP